MKIFFLILTAILASLSLTSCSESEPDDTSPTSALLMVFPWGGNTYSQFLKNVSDMKQAITSQGTLGQTDVLVWIANSKTTALLIRVGIENGAIVCDTLKNYADACPSGANDYTTASGLTSIFSDMKQASPTDSYSLIIGSHGMGWIPKDCDFESKAARLSRQNAPIRTRWWGATSSLAAYCIDVESLAQAIEQNDMQTDYIYFDACYMGSIETAYQLRNATHYLMASPAELLIAGSPFSTVGARLLQKNYEAALDCFIDYYNSVDPACGTMTLIDCTKLDALASIVSEIYSTSTPIDNASETVQSYDGMSEHVFFDLADYVEQLNPTANQLEAFNEAMASAVPYSVHTASVISMYSGSKTITLNKCCGLNTTTPTDNKAVQAEHGNCEWYLATHWGTNSKAMRQ